MLDKALNQVESVLRHRRGLKYSQPDDFDLQTATRIIQEFDNIMAPRGTRHRDAGGRGRQQARTPRSSRGRARGAVLVRAGFEKVGQGTAHSRGRTVAIPVVDDSEMV